jgi:hypothetical protein
MIALADLIDKPDRQVFELERGTWFVKELSRELTFISITSSSIYSRFLKLL